MVESLNLCSNKKKKINNFNPRDVGGMFSNYVHELLSIRIIIIVPGLIETGVESIWQNTHDDICCRNTDFSIVESYYYNL